MVAIIWETGEKRIRKAIVAFKFMGAISRETLDNILKSILKYLAPPQEPKASKEAHGASVKDHGASNEDHGASMEDNRASDEDHGASN